MGGFEKLDETFGSEGILVGEGACWSGGAIA